MRLLAAFLGMAVYAQGAGMKGLVLDSESGHALARTVVTLTPLQNQAGVAQSTRTESNGTFFFYAAPGVYLLTVAREGYATYRQGAVCGICPGAPIYVTNEDKVPFDIRMHRLGAVTGTILDENQIGIPGIPMLVYTATRPLSVAGKVVTDDRGAFRVGLLTPGPYLVRSAPTKTTDGMMYLATFYQDSTELRGAVPFQAELDRTWTGIEYHIVPGKLYRVQGKLIMPVPGITDSIEMISDAGRQKAHVDAAGNYFFDNVAPGDYEFFAEGRTAAGHYAAWMLYTVEHDTDLNVPMDACAVVNITTNDEQHKRIMPKQVKITMRRKDLDQEGPLVQIETNRVDLAPGDWAIKIDGGTEFFAKDVYLRKRAVSRSRSAAEDWVTARIPPGPDMIPMNITLSSRLASVTGRVTNHPNEIAPYAPVWLETLRLEPPDPPLIREVRTGSDGSFEFHALPPGHYRLLSSFDLDISDRPAVERAQPTELNLSEGGSVLQDISLYHKP